MDMDEIILQPMSFPHLWSMANMSCNPAVLGGLLDRVGLGIKVRVCLHPPWEV